MTIEELQAAVAALAAQQTAAPVAPAPAAPPPPAPAAPAIDYAEMAKAIATAMAQQQAPAPAPEAPKPAAAPSAPAGNPLPVHQGMVDIFQPGVAHQLGPQGTREQLEKLWKIGSQMQGAAQRPKIPTRRDH